MDELLRRLESLSQQQKLIEQALATCRLFLQNSASDEAKLRPAGGEADVVAGRKLADIKLRFEKQSLVFKHSLLTEPCIDTQIGLYVDDPGGLFPDGLKPIGRYRLISGLDGALIDDYLEMDEVTRG